MASTLCNKYYEEFLGVEESVIHLPEVCGFPVVAHRRRPTVQSNSSRGRVSFRTASHAPSRSSSNELARESFRSASPTRNRTSSPNRLAREIFRSRSPGINHSSSSQNGMRSASFKNQIVARDERRCCVTSLPYVCVDAVHISPISDGEDTGFCHVNDPRNGFLLASHLHRAYDQHMITVDAEHKVHVLAAQLRGTISIMRLHRTRAWFAEPAPLADLLQRHARVAFAKYGYDATTGDIGDAGPPPDPERSWTRRTGGRNAGSGTGDGGADGRGNGGNGTGGGVAGGRDNRGNGRRRDCGVVSGGGDGKQTDGQARIHQTRGNIKANAIASFCLKSISMSWADRIYVLFQKNMFVSNE